MANSLINGGGGSAPSTSAPAEDRRVWKYRGTEARLFDSPDDVPDGWTDAPTEDAVDLISDTAEESASESTPEAPKRRGRPPRAKEEEGEPDEL